MSLTQSTATYQPLPNTETLDHHPLLNEDIFRNVLSYLPRKEKKKSQKLPLRLVCKRMNEIIENDKVALYYDIYNPGYEFANRKDIKQIVFLGFLIWFSLPLWIFTIPTIGMLTYVRVYTPDYINESHFPDWLLMTIIVSSPVVSLALLVLEMYLMYKFFLYYLAVCLVVGSVLFSIYTLPEAVNYYWYNQKHIVQLERKKYYAKKLVEMMDL